MKIEKYLNRLASVIAGFIIIAPTFVAVPIAHATGSTVGAPGQSGCESGGSTGYLWSSLNHGDPVVRPTISSLSIKADAGASSEVISNFENPSVGDLGATICPGVAMGRRTGLFIYSNTVSGGDFDLTGKLTPNGATITADSEITITIDAGDMGGLAPYYSFSLVHGYVTNWVTSGLGTSNAALNVTLKPVRTPFGNGEDFAFCTATPPNCNADKSDVDALSATLDMTFTTSGEEGGPGEIYDVDGAGSDFRGAYFAMEGAMGAWVQASGQGGQPRSLVATLGGPEHLADGTTANYGSMQAFIPDNVVETMFQTTSEDLISSGSLEVARTDSIDNNDVVNVDLTIGGIMVAIDNFHFSSPTYSIGIAGFNDGGNNDSGGPEDSDTSKTLELPGGGFTNLQTPGGTVITSFTAAPEASQDAKDVAFDFPLGLNSFTMTVPSGSTQLVTLSYVTDLTPSKVTVRKYNATTKTYSTITGATVSEDNFDGQHVLIVEYSITDGGTLDQDGIVNGVIVDPVGLGTTVVAVPNTGFGQ